MKKFLFLIFFLPLSAYSMDMIFGKYGTNFNFGTNRYAPIQGAGSFNNSVEASNQTIFTQGGVLSKPCINVRANTIDVGISTMSIRVNGAEGAEQIYYAAGVTGIIADDVNSDTVANNDKIAWHMFQSGTSGAATIGGMSVKFSPMVPHAMYTGHNNLSTTWGMNASSYVAVMSDNIAGATEVNSQLISRVAGTARNLNMRVVTNTMTAVSTVTFRINGSNGNQVIALGAGVTGFLVDTTNTDIVMTGDLINLKVLAPIGTGAFAVTASVYGVDVDNTNNEFENGYLSALGTSVNASVTRFTGIGGALISNPEDVVYQRSPIAFTASKLRVNLPTNNYTNISTVTFRLSGTTDGNLNIFVPNGSSGQFEDATDSDVVSADQLVDILIRTSAGSASVWNAVVVKGTTAGAVGRTRRMFSIQ